MAAMIPQQEEKKTSSENYVGYPLEQLVNCNNIPEGTNTAFFTYGRFQPAHTGHKKMIEQLLEMALVHNARTGTNITPEKTNVYVFVSPSGGPKEKKPHKNPLSPNQKVDLLQKQYAGYPIHFVNMGEAKAKQERAGPGGAAILLKKCYSNAVMLVGGDRIGAFDWMGNIMDIEFEGISRPPGAMSATAVRKAATSRHQTRQQTSTFENAIQFGAVTPEHAEEIKQMIIQAQPRTTGGKRKTRRRWRKPRRKTRRKRKKKRKTSRRCKRKRKNKRRTRKGICRFR